MQTKIRLQVAAMTLSLMLSGSTGLASGTADDYYWSGKAKYRSGDYRGAIREYNEAVKLAPKSARIYGSRAAAKRKAGDLNGALEDARKAARLGDRDAQRILKKLGYSW